MRWSTAVRDDTAARDFVVSYADRPGTLYRDQLNGQFEATDLTTYRPALTRLSVQDVDHDGLLDLVSYAPKPLVLRNVHESFASANGLRP